MKKIICLVITLLMTLPAYAKLTAHEEARINAMLDASRNYRTFSECPENMDGQVKFIYRTDEVK